MIPITETPDLYPAEVPLVETTDPVLGGPAGPANAAAIALANRTRWLKAAIEAIEAETGLGVTVEDVGEGASLFVEKVGAALRFLTLLEGNNITLTPTPTGLRIDATGGTGTTPDTHITLTGATPDFVPGPGSTGTGTDNSAAINAAIAAALAANKPIYLDTGNYYVANPDTLRALNRINIDGPGQIFGPTNVGITEIGRTLNVGTSRSHEVDFVGGLLLGGESGDGLRQWMGHHNWMQWQPTRPGAPTQVQIYNSANLCAATCQAPDILNASYGTFAIDRMAVGDHVGWNGALYKIAALTSTGQIRVTTFDGASPAFVTNAVTPRFFAHAYETATGTCNVSGSTVTYVSGDQYPYGYNGDHMYAIINGTRHTVTAGPENVGANNLTLSAPAGTLTGATITFRRCHGPWAYVSLLRLQGLAGGVETTAGLYINIKGEAVLFSGATQDSLAGPLRINAKKITLGPDGGEFERLEVDAAGVWLGASSANQSMYNGVRFLGSDAGSGYLPAFAARGADTSLGLAFDIPGTGKYAFTAGAFERDVFEILAPAGTNTWLSASAGAEEATVSAKSSAPNANINLNPKGSGRIKASGNNVADEGSANTFGKYQRVRNDTGPDPITGATNAYGWNALVRAFSGNAWQVVPGMFVGQSKGGSGAVWGVATEAWTGDATTAGTSDVALIGVENAVISQCHWQNQRTIGNNAVFKNRPDGAAAVKAGLGSNSYNRNSIAYWLTAQPRSTAGEYCGWNRGILFDASALDSSVDGKAVGIDFTAVNLLNAECMTFPDGSRQNSGQGAARLNANNTTDVFTVSSAVLQNVNFSVSQFSVGGIGTWNAITKRFTFAIAGVYQISSTVMYSCVTAGALAGFLFIRKNGSNADSNSLKGVHPSRSLTASQDTECAAQGLLDVVAGDYIEVFSYMTFTGQFKKSDNAQAISYLNIHKVA